MKIQKITINNYGPIKRFSLEPEKFECIFGLNESGKTAIIEALSYILFKKNAARLRYGKPEDITVRIEDKGTVYTLPAKKNNPRLLGQSVSNLLYVQASDSAVYEPRKEEKFWDALKALFSSEGRKMTFKELIDKTFEAVELQPVKLEWEKRKYQHIEGMKQRALELKKYIEEIDGIEKKRTELAAASERKKILEKKLKIIEDYKKHQRYKRLSKLYDSYVEKKIYLQEYERYADDYLKRWQSLTAKKESLLNTGKKLKEIKKEINDLEKEIIELEKKAEIIKIEDFASGIRAIEEEKRELSLKYPVALLVGGIVLFVLSFFLKIPKFIPLTVFVIFILFLSRFFIAKSRIKNREEERKKLLKKASVLFPDVSSIKELVENIEDVEKALLEKKTLRKEKEKTAMDLTSEQTIERIEKEISELRNKTGLAEISDLEKKLSEKRRHLNELQKLGIEISTELSEKNDKKWSGMIAAMKTAPPDEEPEHKKEENLREELKKIEEQINDLEKEIAVFEKVQRTKHNITDPRGVFVEYRQLQETLDNYELEKKAALAAREIFEEMRQELEEHIRTLFSGDNSLSEYFNMITGRYKEVNLEDKDFTVTDDQGNKYKIDELSSGAKDQLLICFRIAALERLYPDGVFLILDDAFIFADWQRRKKLTALLKNFINKGNQVIYLTSDDHTRDLLKEEGAAVTTL